MYPKNKIHFFIYIGSFVEIWFIIILEKIYIIYYNIIIIYYNIPYYNIRLYDIIY